jgi:hypothetical protein
MTSSNEVFPLPVCPINAKLRTPAIGIPFIVALLHLSVHQKSSRTHSARRTKRLKIHGIKVCDNEFSNDWKNFLYIVPMAGNGNTEQKAAPFRSGFASIRDVNVYSTAEASCLV